MTWWAAERTASELRRARYEREYEAEARWAEKNPKAAYAWGQLKASLFVWPIVLGGMVAGWYGLTAGVAVTVLSIAGFVFYLHGGGDGLSAWLIAAFFVGTGKVLNILLNE